MILEMLSYLWSLLRVGMTRYTVIFSIVLVVLYIVHWVRERKYQHSLFQRLGIPYVKPHLIHGSHFTLRWNNALATDVLGEWLEKYGDVFGYFVGAKPNIVVKDLDLIRQVLMKDFHNFSNRPKLVIEIQPITHTLIGLRDQRWKDVRSVLAPTFSMAKMKLIIGIMNRRVDELLGVISSHNAKEETLEWYSLFQGLTLDVICECVMAMKRNCQRDQNGDEFFALTRTFLKHAMSPALHLAHCFNVLGDVFAFINNQLAFSGRMTNMIVSHLQAVLKVRRKASSKNYIDVLQLMLEASESQSEPDGNHSNMQNGTSTLNGTTNTAKHQLPDSNLKPAKDGVKKKNLSDEEIIANAWVYMLAGFETSANAITSTAYLLACHPDIQEKLYQELCEHIEDGHEHLAYETVHKLNYLDQVFSEALRIFPPVVNFITRDTNADFQLGDYFIPSDTDIMIPVWQIHHDPKLWPEPFKFNPERFSPAVKASETRHPMSYIPFGAGPRSCPGVRFAQLEAKVAIARLIRTYRLETCEETPIPLKFHLPTVTHIPAEDVIFKAFPRE
ncbi:cytochrome P450 3A29-like [Macrobrachium rosenbergii]|uniref:cytochrome P450 3A29-like n=1 Tax=Macrobrachium rosenbergii TaxID=79674 RepID=UPI0034D4FCCE